MKKNHLSIAVAAAFLVSSCGSLSVYPDRYGSAESYAMESISLGSSRDFTVVLPGDHDPEGSYPVLYVLDGDWNVEPVTRLVDRLVDAEKIPEPILVFIGNGDGETRESDYMYPVDSGGSAAQGDLFYDFMDTELIPHIDASYPTDPENRVLLGHSAAAYFVIYALLQDTGGASDPFHGFLAASPPVFLTDGALFAMEEAASVTDLPRKVSLGVGSLEGVLFNVSIEEFASNLENRGYPGLDLRFRRLQGVSHFSCEYLMYGEELDHVLSR